MNFPCRIAIVACLLFIGTLYAGDSLSYGVELKAGYRDSEHVVFPLTFPFPPEFLPVGAESGALETADPGGHAEVSRFSLFLSGDLSAKWHGRIKVDTVDLYDRNPTPSDNKVDVDEAWLRYGEEALWDTYAEGNGFYLKLGKFGKTERQAERNLESYGLMATVFNRFEDAGVEMGVNLGRHLYVKGSYTTGNPLYFRDTNALAAGNGAPDINPSLVTNPDPEIHSGFPVFYDAEIENLDFNEPEIGFVLGTRVGDPGGVIVDLHVFGYKRDLADTVNLTGSFYGGDLDLLEGPSPELGIPLGLPLDGREKEEYGATLRARLGAATLFAQMIDSDMAGLPRDGYEVELVYLFENKAVWGVGGKPLFPFFQPAVRYSKLNADFTGVKAIAAGIPTEDDFDLYPSPSVWWDWRKLDYGIDMDIYNGLRMTAEYSDNQFFAGGKWHHVDEWMVTFTYRWNGGGSP